MKKIFVIAVMGLMAMGTAAHAETPANAVTAVRTSVINLKTIFPHVYLAEVAAPEPSSVGILAAGAIGLLIRRRKSH
jgi:hypothetical protein